MNPFDTLISAYLKQNPKLEAASALGQCPPCGVAFLLASLQSRSPRSMICVVSTMTEAEHLVEDLEVFLPHPGALVSSEAVHKVAYARLFPEIDMSLFDEGLADAERMHALSDLDREQPVVIVTTLLALLQPAASPDKFRPLEIKVGNSLKELDKKLMAWGYSDASLVERPGQFSQHGPIFDIYPSTGVPKRIQLEAGKVVALRAFDVDDQLSTDQLESISLLSMREPKRDGRLLDCVSAETPVVFIEESRLRARLEEMGKAADAGWRFSAYDNVEILHNARPDDWEEISEMIGSRPRIHISSEDVGVDVHLEEAPDVTLPELAKFDAQGELCLVTAHTKRIRGILTRRAIKAEVIEGSLASGLSSPGLFHILSDAELLGAVRGPRESAKVRWTVDGDFDEGDLAVHAERGIGRFEGLVPVELVGHRRDLIKLSYAQEHTLMVPPDQIENLTPYRAGDEENPPVSRLDTAAWQKTRAKAEASVAASAKALRQRRKEREARRAQPIARDGSRQEELEEQFPYEETPSQLQAVEEIKRDMEREVSMDRLLCGDVGYGKTEVALRACFKAVAGGLQAAVLAPTTVLAQQHYETFRKRLEPLGVKMLGLWGSGGSVEGLASGEVELVVGTHRILSADVSFARLGLLVVDEEQQFGVHDKERLTKLAEGVHLLSMSATPIPRTMQLSLAGVRDVSLLDAPPARRRAVRTYLLMEESRLITAALMRELERGGQVFFLHNKVADLPKLAARLEKLMAGRARVAVAHGQMPGAELETVLRDFGERKYDVLVCSTIIESGVDFPNVNSILIKDAHNFGLSQLYQIRGRVGRGERQAFCYLLLPKTQKLSPKAQLRLDTIKRFTELGSGYRIALQDLEIRGAGDLLGGNQSGQIAKVGYVLYSQLLEQALSPAKTEIATHPCVIDLPLDFYIPTEYLPDPGLRIELYRRMSQMTSRARLEKLELEIEDRFGPPPEPLANLLALAHLRLLAVSQGVKSIRWTEKWGETHLVVDEVEMPRPPRGPAVLGFLVEHLAKTDADKQTAGFMPNSQ